MATIEKGRKPGKDWFPWLVPPVDTAIGDMGLLELCKKAKCEKGRRSIGNWLDGRKRNTKAKTTDRPPRALPESEAFALMGYLSVKYPEDFQKVGRKGLDWFADQMEQLQVTVSDELGERLKSLKTQSKVSTDDVRFVYDILQSAIFNSGYYGSPDYIKDFIVF